MACARPSGRPVTRSWRSLPRLPSTRGTEPIPDIAAREIERRRDHAAQGQTRPHDAVLVADATDVRKFTLPAFNAVPGPELPYELTDPFLLIGDVRFVPYELANQQRWAT